MGDLKASTLMLNENTSVFGLPGGFIPFL